MIDTGMRQVYSIGNNSFGMNSPNIFEILPLKSRAKDTSGIGSSQKIEPGSKTRYHRVFLPIPSADIGISLNH